jgi:hypothetical protein
MLSQPCLVLLGSFDYVHYGSNDRKAGEALSRSGRRGGKVRREKQWNLQRVYAAALVD